MLSRVSLGIRGMSDEVIFISGYTEDAFRQRLNSESDIDFLPKPFSLKQLTSKVKDVIGGGPR